MAECFKAGQKPCQRSVDHLQQYMSSATNHSIKPINLQWIL